MEFLPAPTMTFDQVFGTKKYNTKIPKNIHLYIGCKAAHPCDRAQFDFIGISKYGNPILHGDWSGGTNPQYANDSTCKWNEFKLLLRSLSDMTIAEARKAYKLEFNTKSKTGATTVWDMDAKAFFENIDCWQPKTAIYLISRGFDLGLVNKRHVLDRSVHDQHGTASFKAYQRLFK